MAGIDFDEFDNGYVSHNGNSRWVNLLGAACSVALLIGVAVWGYKLAVRNVEGVPVVRAIEGPLRMSPENPGGQVAMHQGLSVNAVASSGTAAPLPETLILAPQDVDLAAEDAAGLAVLSALESAAPAASAPVVSTLSDSPVVARPVEVAAMPAPEMPTDLAVSEPLPATQEEAVAAALAAALSEEIFEEAPVVAASAVAALRPRPRPAALGGSEAAAVAAETPTTAAAPVTEIDPSTILTGTRLVQLGAFDDAAGARGEWTRLAGQFPELLSTKSMVIQSAESGGRTFYRLRAYGFETDGDSRRFCAAFLAENASCIPVSQR